MMGGVTERFDEKLRFDKIAGSDFGRAQRGPEGAKGRMPGAILSGAPSIKQPATRRVF